MRFLSCPGHIEDDARFVSETFKFDFRRRKAPACRIDAGSACEGMCVCVCVCVAGVCYSCILRNYGPKTFASVLAAF